MLAGRTHYGRGRQDMIRLLWWKRRSVEKRLVRLAKVKRGESIQEWMERVDVEISKILDEDYCLKGDK